MTLQQERRRDRNDDDEENFDLIQKIDNQLKKGAANFQASLVQLELLLKNQQQQQEDTETTLAFPHLSRQVGNSISTSTSEIKLDHLLNLFQPIINLETDPVKQSRLFAPLGSTLSDFSQLATSLETIRVELLLPFFEFAKSLSDRNDKNQESFHHLLTSQFNESTNNTSSSSSSSSSSVILLASSETAAGFLHRWHETTGDLHFPLSLNFRNDDDYYAISKLFTDRLNIIYGPSGCGKTTCTLLSCCSYGRAASSPPKTVVMYFLLRTILKSDLIDGEHTNNSGGDNNNNQNDENTKKNFRDRSMIQILIFHLWSILVRGKDQKVDFQAFQQNIWDKQEDVKAFLTSSQEPTDEDITKLVKVFKLSARVNTSSPQQPENNVTLSMVIDEAGSYPVAVRALCSIVKKFQASLTAVLGVSCVILAVVGTGLEAVYTAPSKFLGSHPGNYYSSSLFAGSNLLEFFIDSKLKSLQPTTISSSPIMDLHSFLESFKNRLVSPPSNVVSFRFRSLLQTARCSTIAYKVLLDLHSAASQPFADPGADAPENEKLRYKLLRQLVGETAFNMNDLLQYLIVSVTNVFATLNGIGQLHGDRKLLVIGQAIQSSLNREDEATEDLQKNIASYGLISDSARWVEQTETGQVAQSRKSNFKIVPQSPLLTFEGRTYVLCYDIRRPRFTCPGSSVILFIDSCDIAPNESLGQVALEPWQRFEFICADFAYLRLLIAPNAFIVAQRNILFEQFTESLTSRDSSWNQATTAKCIIAPPHVLFSVDTRINQVYRHHLRFRFDKTCLRERGVADKFEEWKALIQKGNAVVLINGWLASFADVLILTPGCLFLVQCKCYGSSILYDSAASDEFENIHTTQKSAMNYLRGICSVTKDENVEDVPVVICIALNKKDSLGIASGAKYRTKKVKNVYEFFIVEKEHDENHSSFFPLAPSKDKIPQAAFEVDSYGSSRSLTLLAESVKN